MLLNTLLLFDPVRIKIMLTDFPICLPFYLNKISWILHHHFCYVLFECTKLLSFEYSKMLISSFLVYFLWTIPPEKYVCIGVKWYTIFFQLHQIVHVIYRHNLFSCIIRQSPNCFEFNTAFSSKYYYHYVILLSLHNESFQLVYFYICPFY